MAHQHSIPTFPDHLAEYISRIEQKKAQVPTVYARAKDLPFQPIDVYHSFRLALEGLNDDGSEQDWVKASPLEGGRYDTVVVLDGDEADMVSLNGMWSLSTRSI